MSALLTLTFGTLPDSLPVGHGTFLDSFSHSGLTVFLQVKCGLSAPVSGKMGIATMLGHQHLTIWAPEREEGVLGGHWNTRYGKQGSICLVYLSVAT